MEERGTHTPQVNLQHTLEHVHSEYTMYMVMHGHVYAGGVKVVCLVTVSDSKTILNTCIHHARFITHAHDVYSTVPTPL